MALSFDGNHVFIEIDVANSPTSTKHRVTALIDTGFSGFLTLNYTQAFPLGLSLKGSQEYVLGNNSIMESFICGGFLFLDEFSTEAEIDVRSSVDVVVGMKLFSVLKKRLVIDFEQKSAHIR